VDRSETARIVLRLDKMKGLVVLTVVLAVVCTLEVSNNITNNTVACLWGYSLKL